VSRFLSLGDSLSAASKSALLCLLQASDEDMAGLLLKMPHVLRTSVKRLEENMHVFCDATGLEPSRLLRVCHSWPILPTMSKDTLQSRWVPGGNKTMASRGWDTSRGQHKA
jgi:hypothetical protein